MNVEESSENYPQITRRAWPITYSYLRALSLPTYEMAMKTMGRKVEETPPPKLQELHIESQVRVPLPKIERKKTEM